MVSGNKGEWSEFYVLLKLLAEGKLYAADDKAERIDDMFFPILSVYRSEKQNKRIEYDIPVEGAQHIAIHMNDVAVGTVERNRLSNEANVLFEKIMEGGDKSFAIPVMEDIMDTLLCERLAAPASDKTDIQLHIHDIQTGFDQISGFSIKSQLGSASTLLNASGATNFVYDVIGISDNQMEEINSIGGSKKILKRIDKTVSEGNLSYREVANRTFEGNLMLLDTVMDKLIGEALLIYYKGEAGDCMSVVKALEKNNPLNVKRKGFYEYKFKKFLCAVALGMIPSKEWDGRDEANGGYIIVTKKGDVLAYHIYNRDFFEDYLLENTRFERASTSRHGFAKIYKDESGNKYIKLNLQIRFK